jgi:hypothetical protein
VDVLLNPAARWIAAGLGLLMVGLIAAAPAAADSTSFVLAPQPVVRITLHGTGNDVTVRSWDRPFVEVDSDGSAQVNRSAVTWGTPTRPLVARLPPFHYVQRQDGEIVGDGLQPPEDFPFAGFRAGPHDVLAVTAPPGARLVVIVPYGTGILDVNSTGGQTTIEGYHGANLFVLQGTGRVRIENSDTTAFVQQQNGTMGLGDDTFERLRVRVNAANVVFERCRTTQIEASTVSGPIVYDGGTFEPGLARFESESGSIALGVSSGAELVAHAEAGKVFTQFDGPTQVAQHGDGDATAMVAGGGALVNAISQRGNVYLYDGAFADHPNLGPEWRPVRDSFNRRQPPSRRPYEQRMRRRAPAQPAGFRARTFGAARRPA